MRYEDKEKTEEIKGGPVSDGVNVEEEELTVCQDSRNETLVRGRESL